MTIYFVYAGVHYFDSVHEDRLKSFILNGMKKYKIKKVIVQMFNVMKSRLITKEKMENICKGNDELYNDFKESINDDIESLFEDLRLGIEPKHYVKTYFLPKLTKEELILVERKDENFRQTFFIDVPKDEMEASESDSKFNRVFCYRKTLTIEKSLKRKISS